MSVSLKKRLKFSKRAVRDYVRVLDYIASENFLNAALVQGRIENALTHIASFPDIGHKGREPGTREFVVPKTSHTIIYRVTASTVIVGQFVHQAQDRA